MDEQNKTAPTANNKPTKKFLFILLGIVLLACLGGVISFLQSAVVSRDQDIASLNAKAEQLGKDKQSLDTKNINLEKAVKTLQNQLDKNGQSTISSDNQITNGETATKPIAKMVVSMVKDQPGSDFTLPGQPQIKDSLRAVRLTITNLTDSEQTYDHFQFEATLTSGAIVKPRVYSPLESTVWNSSKLAAGASADIVLLFGTDQNLATLNWSPAGTKEPITVALPAPQS